MLKSHDRNNDSNIQTKVGETEAVIKNRQSIESGNIAHTGHWMKANKTKQHTES